MVSLKVEDRELKSNPRRRKATVNGCSKNVGVPNRKTRNCSRRLSRGSGGGGSFLACEDFGRMFDQSFPACAFFFFFFEVKISTRTNSTVLGQDQSTVAQPAETTVAECSMTSCV